MDAGRPNKTVLRGPQYATCAEVPFQRLSHFFTMISGQARETQGPGGKGPSAQERSRLLRRFFELYMPRSHDTYQIMRLLTPDVGAGTLSVDFFPGSRVVCNNWQTANWPHVLSRAIAFNLSLLDFVPRRACLKVLNKFAHASHAEQADRVARGNYNLQQTRLARALCLAANIPKASKDSFCISCMSASCICILPQHAECVKGPPRPSWQEFAAPKAAGLSSLCSAAHPALNHIQQILADPSRVA